MVFAFQTRITYFFHCLLDILVNFLTFVEKNVCNKQNQLEKKAHFYEFKILFYIDSNIIMILLSIHLATI